MRLDESLKFKLTLLTAPAGFGKTTLLKLWYQKKHRNHVVSWVTLDERDEEILRRYGPGWRHFRMTGPV